MTKFEIYFKHKEQVDFLQKHGWTMEYNTVECPEQVHGSQFNTRTTCEASALKGGLKFNLEYAFSMQMKECLLKL